MTPARRVPSEILTVMFIDMVGYTRTTSHLSREQVDQLLTTFEGLALPVFDAYHGTVIKKIGDAFLVTFKSATDAIHCGIELQSTFARHGPLRIRVAVHTGEVVHRQDDIYGDTVNAAARIEGVAEAGQVVFSEATFHAMNKNEVPRWQTIGVKHLKGLKHPLRLFRIVSKADVVRQHVAATRNALGRLLLWIIIIAALIAIAYYIGTSTTYFEEIAQTLPQ